MSPVRIVVIGASGHFGGRICRRILGEPNTELIVTSRRLDRAQSLAGALNVTAAALDHSSSNFEEDLAALQPDITIHTAGPYQGQDYRVARACMACGSHYIDLADGRAFVEGFDTLHDDARRRDVLLVSGASTLPGVSSAVIDAARSEFAAIERIETSIAPAHQTPRGVGTIAAVLSYCGKPFEVLEDGQWRTRYGWQDLKLQRYPEFGRRLSAACDVPDLGLLPRYVDGVQTVTFHAALEASWEQITLWKMAWTTRLGIVSSWETLAAGIRFDHAGVHGEALAADKTGRHAAMHHALEHQSEGRAVAKPAMAVQGKRRVIRHPILETQPAEPTIREIEMHPIGAVVDLFQRLAQPADLAGRQVKADYDVPVLQVMDQPLVRDT